MPHHLPVRRITAALLSCLAWSLASAQDFKGCFPALREQAAGQGLSRLRFDQWTATLRPDLSVVRLLDDQPEFKTPIWDYMAALVDAERVSDGQARLAQWKDTLEAAARRYGVEPAVVVAVWGVESDYGRAFGKRPLLTSLGTLSCFGRRQAYFRGEFLSLLHLIDQGDLRVDGANGVEDLVGSWAGAFGHTQFMPSTYQRLAVDFDGDGRRDLVGSVPDALASTAHFLQRAGWRRGQPWGFEVRLPEGFDVSWAGRRRKRPLSHWLAKGLRLAQGQALSAAGADGLGPAGLLLPAGPRGPAFLVFANFDAIFGYNAAESYALAIAHLSDRLQGGPPLAQAWPTPDPGLSRAERRELQGLLAARGHPMGEIDGMLGTASRAAIQAEQRERGLAPDGRAGQRLLAILRGDNAGAGR